MFSEVLIVKRDEIPAIYEIEEGGKKHILGVHRDFRRHPVLSQFIPEDARLAMSWALLEPGQVLTPHVHPIVSMIVVTRGSGRLLGQLSATLEEGDAVLVGTGCLHGFEGRGPEGMQVLSFQFEARGLYEDAGKPLVRFPPEGTLDSLLHYNATRLDELVGCRLFRMLEDGTLDDPARWNRFLDCLHAWSRHFQTILYARQACCDDERYRRLFLRHLRDEQGHDELLLAARGTPDVIWDPVIESTSAWFVSRMFLGDNCDKAAIVHLVLETTGARFHELACRHLSRVATTEYFSVHRDDDDDHADWGMELIQNLSPESYARLRVVVAQGWDMLSTMFTGMAELVLAVPPTET
jgi:quercetin dioxygenase-like cupin family protein